nr:VOC family protein [Mycolicibacterium sp. F2034L]
MLEPRDEYLGLGPVAAVVIDALDPAAQARFWSGATGLEIARAGDVVASLRQDGAYFVEFIRVPTATAGPNRVRLRVQGPVAPTDPEGNEITAE